MGTPMLAAKARSLSGAVVSRAHAAAWWGDKEYPPSTVLGIGKDVSSGVFGITSGIALIVGLYCVAQSNLLNILSGSTVKTLC